MTEIIYNDIEIKQLFREGLRAEIYALASDSYTKGQIENDSLFYIGKVTIRQMRYLLSEKIRGGGNFSLLKAARAIVEKR